MRIVLLQALDEEVQQERLARAGRAQDECVRDILLVQVQVVGRGLVGLKDCKILATQMAIRRFAGVNRE